MSTLYVMVGLSGTGKSTAADIIREKTNGTIHRTDSIRKEIVNGEPTYSRSESQRVYDALFSRAADDLSNGSDVVLDATFSLKMGRENAEDVANQTNSQIRFVHITSQDQIIRERLRNRTNTDSDADISVYEKQQDSFEPLEREHTTIDNSSDLQTLEHKIEQDVV
jgi:predicted kinase